MDKNEFEIRLNDYSDEEFDCGSTDARGDQEAFSVHFARGQKYKADILAEFDRLTESLNSAVEQLAENDKTIRELEETVAEVME